jgi:hypothetical protein
LCVYLRRFSAFPLVCFLCVNMYGAGNCGISGTFDRLATAAMSFISPSVNIGRVDRLACPTIQRDYYTWNRNNLAGVMFSSMILVTILVNTTFVDQFCTLCQIHSLPDCKSSLIITTEQFNTILLPVVIRIDYSCSSVL